MSLTPLTETASLQADATSTRKPMAALVATNTVCGMTHNKWLALAPMLKEAGYDVVVLVWSEETANVAATRQVPVLRASLVNASFNKLAEAKRLHELLNRPIVTQPAHLKAPTWGDLLAFDDFIGAAQWWQIAGLDVFHPDILIVPFPGAELSSTEDEQVMMAINRYARLAKIPLLALETQKLDCVLHISRPQVDCLLTKYAYPQALLAPLARASFALPPAWRYLCNGGLDTELEEFLQREAGLRQQLHWEPGRSYLFLPFHVYYMEECARVLAALGKHTEVLEQRQIEVLIGCGVAHRRNLMEKDLIIEGLKRWLVGIPKWSVVEGGHTLHWALLAEFTVLPYASSGIEDAAARWGLTLVRRIPDLLEAVRQYQPTVSPLSAIAWLLESKNRTANEQ